MKIYKLALLALLFGPSVSLHSFSVMDTSEDEVIGATEVDPELEHFDQIIDFTSKNDVDSLRKLISVLKFMLTNDQLKQLMNKADINGYTPLSIALNQAYFDCAELLIDNGADLSLTDKTADGFTPIMWSIMAINDLNMEGNDNLINTLVDLVVYSKKAQLIKDVLAKRISEQQQHDEYERFLNQTDYNNKTALWHASKCEHLYARDLLISEGAVIDENSLYKIIKNEFYQHIITPAAFQKMSVHSCEQFIENLNICLDRFLKKTISDDKENIEMVKKYVKEVHKYFNKLRNKLLRLRVADLAAHIKDDEGLKSVKSKNIFDVLKAREFAKR